jgi:hypothetical protein
MTQPIDGLRVQYALLGRTIDSSLKRLKLKNAQPDEEALVLQGAYLFGVRAFEYFLESQIIYLCNPNSNWGPKEINGLIRRYVRKISEENPSRVKAMLTMGASYTDYLPYERTERKARVLFARGRPFSLLPATHSEIIKRAHVVRNLIAHESEHSMKQFMKVVCSRYSLRPERRNAAGYLFHEAIKGVPMAKQDLSGLMEAAIFLS